MKAFLLAAGKGTRLRPLTHHTPKCLVPVCGIPLIEYWFQLFERYGIDDVLINTSHLAEKVNDYIQSRARTVNITLTFEENLLGSGGTIKKNWDFVKGERSFFVLYADNLTDIDLREMSKFHDESKKDFTLALFKVQNPRECGIVTLDENSTVVSFIEKPESPASDLAFAGIMLSNTRLIDFFPEDDTFDLGYEVLPKITGHASGYIMKGYLQDIGTREKLSRAEKDMKNGIIKLNIVSSNNNSP